MFHVESQLLLAGIVRLKLDRLQSQVADVLEPEDSWAHADANADVDDGDTNDDWWYVDDENKLDRLQSQVANVLEPEVEWC